MGWKKHWTRILKGVAALSILNFLVFFTVTLYVGGDAVNGKAEAGRYYLASHGRYTEVSRALFHYNKVHAYSVWVTHALFFACLILLQWGSRGRDGSKVDHTG